jgi:hypothetical protein
MPLPRVERAAIIGERSHRERGAGTRIGAFHRRLTHEDNCGHARDRVEQLLVVVPVAGRSLSLPHTSTAPAPRLRGALDIYKNNSAKVRDN